MTLEQVINYKQILYNILEQRLISLIIYKGWEKNDTLSPEKINKVFDNDLNQVEYSNFGNKNNLIYLVS